MEESLEETNLEGGLDECVRALFGVEEKDWDQFSPLPLAFLGDSVYDLVIRTVLVARGSRQTAGLHGDKSRLVRAGAQAAMLAALQDHLTEAEKAVCRRGRNAHPANTAKNASRREYLDATGFEALLGWLYLRKEYDRIAELIRTGLEETGSEI